MSTDKPLLLLFDANALIHRAFHAVPPLTVSNTGEMVNAVQGFAATPLRVLNEVRPTHWAVAFDRPTPTFRHQKFEDYKAQRPETPQELVGQLSESISWSTRFVFPCSKSTAMKPMTSWVL